MGFDKSRRPILPAEGVEYSTVFAEGTRDFVESITLSSAVSTMAAEGVSFVTYDSSGVDGAIIPDPPRAGAHKVVPVSPQTTSTEAAFYLSSTGRSFFGSTHNEIALAVTSTDVTRTPFFSLVGQSTTTWAVSALSSTGDWAFAKSTGSTGQG